MLTVGELLHNTRTQKNISLKVASKETRIQLKYLKALEENNWALFTSKVYITGVLRSYGLYLGLDPAHVLAYFRRDYEKKEEIRFRKKLPSLSFLPETKKFIIGAIVAISLLFSSYFGYQLYLYVAPPKVAILTPTKTVFRNTDKIKIIGQTQKEATIRIFDEDIFPNSNGIFEYELPLKKGKNNIAIFVTGANGKKTEVDKEYTLE